MPSAPAIQFQATASSLPAKLAIFAADIKIHHTVFAMPWALLSAVLALHRTSWAGAAGKIGLILTCMVCARTVAMASNRLLDAQIDAKNPRTARRAIPGGKLPRSFVAMMLAICALGFIAACTAFLPLYRNPWPLILSLPVLAFIGLYPLLKRFSELCHYYLGASLALAPLCAWAAVTGTIALPPLLMAVAVICWTAGFDIIYACQDYDVDVRDELHSVPARLGIAGALWVSRITHLGAAAVIVALGFVTPEFRFFYATGAAAAVLLLVIEHALVRGGDLSKLNLAFFSVNGIISVVVGALGIVDVVR